MNWGQLKKNVGCYVRFDPSALAPNGAPLDGEWLIENFPDNDTMELANLHRGFRVRIGSDGIYGFTRDPNRETVGHKHGVLQLNGQVRLRANGSVDFDPLPHPRASAAVAAPRLHPLVVRDGANDRLFSWRDRDPVHLLVEERPVQLNEFYASLCDALRVETGREPEFCDPVRLTGDLIYELSADLRARSPLLGGNGGKPGSALLVLTNRRAKDVARPVDAPKREPKIKWVDLKYPTRTGLKQAVEADGYKVTWRRDDKPRNDDAELVVEIDSDGEHSVLKVRDLHTSLTLYKRPLGPGET